MTRIRKRLALLSAVVLAASAAIVSGVARNGVAVVAPHSISALATQPSTRDAITARHDLDPQRADPADPKLLQALLPDAIGTLKRGDIDAGIRSMGEMRSSLAQTVYSDDANPAAGHVSVKIVDYIAMPGMLDSAAPWQADDINTETDDEYSRTVMVGPNKALEAYSKQSHSGSINILVAGRFVVTVDVEGLPAEALRQTASGMKLDQLSALAK